MLCAGSDSVTLSLSCLIMDLFACRLCRNMVFRCCLHPIQGPEGSTLQYAGPLSTPTSVHCIHYEKILVIVQLRLSFMVWCPVHNIKCLIKKSSMLLLPFPDRKKTLSRVVRICCTSDFLLNSTVCILLLSAQSPYR